MMIFVIYLNVSERVHEKVSKHALCVQVLHHWSRGGGPEPCWCRGGHNLEKGAYVILGYSQVIHK